MNLIHTIFNRKRGVSLLLALLFFIGMTSCKKKYSEVGTELQPSGDQITISDSDTFDINTTSVYQESTDVSELDNALIGSMSDPIFGETKATFYTQIRLNGDNLDFSIDAQSGLSSDLVVDSVVLSFHYADNGTSYGTSTDQQIFEVYELDKELFLDSSYYYNSDASVKGSNLALNGVQIPNLIDSVTVGSSREPAQLRLKLDPTFGQSIIDLSTTNSITKDNFKTFVKGLRISSTHSGTGSILSVNPLSLYSKMTLYYRDAPGNNVPLSYDFIISENAARFSKIDHNYSGTDVESLLTDENLGKNQFYVQAGFGLKGKVFFPDIKSLNSILVDDLGNSRVINRALLILPIQGGTDATYSVPEAFILSYKDADGNEYQIPGESLVSYNASSKQYELNITRFIQQILNGTLENTDVYLTAINFSQTTNRAVLLGQNNGAKLQITFSKI